MNEREGSHNTVLSVPHRRAHVCVGPWHVGQQGRVEKPHMGCVVCGRSVRSGLIERRA